MVSKRQTRAALITSTAEVVGVLAVTGGVAAIFWPAALILFGATLVFWSWSVSG